MNCDAVRLTTDHDYEGSEEVLPSFRARGQRGSYLLGAVRALGVGFPSRLAGSRGQVGGISQTPYG